MTIERVRAMEDQMLTPSIAAKVLGVNPQSIRVAAREAPQRLGFPTVCVGTRVLIPRMAFLNYLDGRTTHA